MTAFPALPEDDYSVVYMEDTDRTLPKKILQSTRYTSFKTIARGGKSIIKSCKDLHLGRVICYKTLRPELQEDPVEQRRFLREARVSAMLQHPNTIPTYEVGRDPRGHYYFTMKFVHGHTLREILDSTEPDKTRRQVHILKEIAQALDYAHHHRVIHRDIKPENILVGPFGEVLLLDWGLAKVWTEEGNSVELSEPGEIDPETPVRSITGQGNLQGTIEYMSPEQLKRDPEIDYRTDIYSLGAVLYEILAGQPPSVAQTVGEMTREICDVTPRKPSDIVGTGIPERLEEVAMQCISKDPLDRVQGCSDIVRILSEGW
ncbi:MAG: serine/threonine-protein kinase [Verrucomicrobia bacterium]|nr:serine/threonine-protein kinase [Verrucomicrobiota bacterium]